MSHPEAAVPHPIPVVFMGSPAFAVPTLDLLATDPRFAVRLVVTQPPKPSGRGKVLVRSEVHEAAERFHLPVWSPERLRGEAALARLREVAATLHIVAAYGKILRRDVLDIPSHGTLNVHASLLPAYRGASPITAAILDGIGRTGVTIMLLDEGLDTGAILSQAEVDISRDDTTPTLTDKLAKTGARLLVESAANWVAGGLVPQPQDASRATLTRTLVKGDGVIDFTQLPEYLVRLERAYTPWPGIYTFLDGTRILFHELYALPDLTDAPPGTILAIDREGIRIAAGGHILRVAQVQPAGKALMPARAFASGRAGLVGMRFGVV